MTTPAPLRSRKNTPWISLLAVLGLLAVMIVLLLRTGQPAAGDQAHPVIVYCAAGLKGPVEAAAKAYEKEFHVPIHLTYGGSGTLLASLEVSQQGDLYLPADDSYIVRAREKDLVAESIPLAHMTAVLAVQRGNPKQVRSLDDLKREGVTFAQANPDAAAIGKLTRRVLQTAGQWKWLEAKTTVFKPTVNEVANDVKLGTVDAGFIWDALLHLYPTLESVPVPLLTPAQARVTVGVLKRSAQPREALRFARYLNAPEKGYRIWREQGFDAIAGDAWAVQPTLHLLGGAMLRPAIEETITAFEQREGVDVIRVYNGCGILVAQMKAGERPDAYFSCDTSFMKQVSDLFLDAEDISQNQLVIVVPKENPHAIASLADLGQPGLRVGVGHEQKCAMGALTRRMLTLTGTYDAIMKNVQVQSPTGDFLVNQLRTGSLDAVIAYLSNVANSRDVLKAIPINVPSALAVQPVAVGRASSYKLLTSRLIDAIKSADSRTRFEKIGFHWQVRAGNKSERGG
jgi:molybdate transport system substrate-binding protein